MIPASPEKNIRFISYVNLRSIISYKPRIETESFPFNIKHIFFFQNYADLKDNQLNYAHLDYSLYKYICIINLYVLNIHHYFYLKLGRFVSG